MIVSSALIADGSFRRDLVVNSLDASIMEHAGEIFESYRGRGTISAENINSDFWILTDERERVSLSFNFNEFLYRRFAENWIRCDLSLLIQYLKAFILMKMGSLGIDSLRSIICAMNQLLSVDDPLMFSSTNNIYIAEFLRLLPGSCESREALAERLVSISPLETKSGDQRLLADFTAYLHFHDSMKAVWEASSEEDRLFLFPLWLWWHLTMILPLRPTEFTLTPYDCLFTHDDRRKIRIRRTRLKGGGEGISYTVDGDFVVMEYDVPDNIATQILWYQKALKDRGYAHGRYLFSIDYYYEYLHAPRDRRSHEHYRYNNLNCTLKTFYSRFSVQDPSESRLHLGDTRHLAMINLIISGGSPVICRELAGHDSIDVSSHYYSNIASLVECATYEFYRKSAKAYADPPSRSPHYELDIPVKRMRINGGWCCSPEFLSRSVRDCVLSVSSSGELGSCDDCRFFRPDRSGMIFHFEDPDWGKERVKADSWFLMYMTETVRLGGAASGDLYRALLKLQNSCCDYRNALLKALYRKENKHNGPTKEKQFK